MAMQHPSATALAAAIALASCAPRLEGSDGWQWRVTLESLDLLAVAPRGLPSRWPLLPGPMLSCGATLHHVTVAVAAAGWTSAVCRLPEPLRPSLLASITFSPATAGVRELELAAAMTARQTDRRPLSAREVTAADRDRLAAVAAQHGSVAVVVGQVESEPTSGRVGGTADPTTTKVVSLLVSASSDDTLSYLRAGEALSAVVLEATRLGFATVIDTGRLSSDVPAVIVQVGWPSSADPLPSRGELVPACPA